MAATRRAAAWTLRAAATGLCLAAMLSSCGPPPQAPAGSYRIRGQTYTPLRSAEGFREVGLASWYGDDFHGRPTANGETYDMYGRTAAHKLLPLGTVVRITHLGNGRSVEARINDRGPFVDGRVVDLSYTLARDLQMVEQGVARVEVQALSGPGGGPAPPQQLRGPFAWQVGAFVVRDNAERLAGNLRQRFDPVTVEIHERGATRFYRVRVGNYDSEPAAAQGRSDLGRLGTGAFLVRRD